MRFHASVVTTEAVDDPFPGSVDATTTSWQNERNYFTTVKPESDTTLKYLPQFCQINGILVIADVARKSTLIAVNLITPADLSL